jgi:endonuclease/exonuclease/phosphatase family metal-dependent hydrolase
MKHFKLILIAACLFFSLNPYARSADPVTLRVLSYNIHHGEGIDGKLDLKRIADVILSETPDLVAVQEVDKQTNRTDQVDQPKVLGELTGMHVRFEKNIDFGGGEYGNAILSRFPIRSHKNVHLPNIDNGEQRGVLIADIEVPGLAAPVRFLSTHLDYRRPDEERIKSARRINELMQQEFPRALAILAGDLNATPESEPLKILKQQWSLPDDKIYPTIPVEKPTRQIDYVLFRPADSWTVSEVKVLDEKIASDHRAILVVLTSQAP